MTAATEIQTEMRETKGTGAARALRNKGMVPGIVYGGKEEPCAIAVDYKNLMKEVERGGFFSRMYTLPLGKKKQSVVAKDIQFDRVTDRPVHVDFMRVDKGASIHVHVPVHFINESVSPGIKRGGVMNVITHQVEIICPADAIPESFTIDLADIEIGHSVHIEAITLPKDATFANKERDYTIVSVSAPRGMTEAEAKGDGEGSAEAGSAE